MGDNQITTSSVSVEALKKIFENAAYKTSLHSTGNLWILDSYMVAVRLHETKKHICFFTVFTPKPEATMESRLTFVNDWNKKCLFPRAVDVGPGIVFDFLVWIGEGIPERSLVASYKTFLDGFQSVASRDNIMARIFNIPKVENNLYGSGTGGSFETAVVINADDTLVGVRAEHDYVAGECGQRGQDWNLEKQSLQTHNGKPFDVLSVKLSSGQARTFYFDISRFFGK
jgi:putative sensory transduction regulator